MPDAYILDAEIRKDRQRRELAHLATIDDDELADMMMDGVIETADGCEVEPDGRCPHGYRSPLLVMGVI